VHRPPKPWATLLLCTLAAAAAGPELHGGATPVDAAAQVVPIDWRRFKPFDQLAPHGRDLSECAQLLRNCARYNFAWAPRGAADIETRGLTITGRQAHDVIRPACSAAYALAAALKTGLFDERPMGLSRKEALARTARLIAAPAAAHKNRCWKYPWQSALWAAQLGHAAWLLWDELDAGTRRLVAPLVVFEADRFLDYRVPYWNGRGGDTKAEENAWNAMVLQIAVAMMPGHAHARRWKHKASELMVSAYSLKSDLRNETLVDGKPVKNWLGGYNVRHDGAVINHGFLHPDYMACLYLMVRGHVVQPLAGQPVPESVDFNAPFIYRTFVVKAWPSPPYAKPGGTIYRPGEPAIYYPQRADWSRRAYVNYYALDVYAHLLGWDAGLPHRAQEWMRVRAKAILAQQARHADGHIWAKGEFDTWPGREQTAGHLLANAYLLLWLHAQGIPLAKANWLAAP